MESGDCAPSEVLEPSKDNTLEFLPFKSKERYELAYQQFVDWAERKNVEAPFSENVLLAYFEELSTKMAPSTMWSLYSMIRSIISFNKSLDISRYNRLKSFLKQNSEGFIPKKTKVLTSEEINRFLQNAPDSRYLLQKIVLIVGINGACRKHELAQLKVEDITDIGSAYLININDSKTKKPRCFTITGNFYTLLKKYASLRPRNTRENRFFLNYKNEKCIEQPAGINKIGNIPKQVALYLGLKDPGLYTGHCYRRSSATFSLDAGNVTPQNHQRSCESTSATENYVEESVQKRIKIEDTCNDPVLSSTIGTSQDLQDSVEEISEDVIWEEAPKNRQKKHQLKQKDIEEQLLSYINTQLGVPEDADELFFKSILPMVKTLSDDAKINLRCDILRLVQTYRNVNA